MKVTQIKDLLTPVLTEVLGEDAVLTEDLSNLVDLGNQVIGTDNVDNYVRKLVDRIGKVTFDQRLYAGGVPSVVKDAWEYGAIVEKISADLPEVSENDSWQLQDGQSYNQDVFYQPKVSAKFFSKKITFEIKLSFTAEQVKGSFASVTELNSFLTMLEVAVQNALTLHLDNLIQRTINNYAGVVINRGQALQKVNLLDGFNKLTGGSLTAEKALTNKDFLRYAVMQVKTYQARLAKYSTLFNVEKTKKFTPSAKLHTILLTDFKDGADAYLSSETIHPESVTLPAVETVPYWQGSGTDYAFNSISSIDVKVDDGKGSTVEVKQAGILGVMFDDNTLGVANLSQRVTTAVNARGEFYTNFYKADAGYYNDLSENFVVFYIADAE